MTRCETPNNWFLELPIWCPHGQEDRSLCSTRRHVMSCCWKRRHVVLSSKKRCLLFQLQEDMSSCTTRQDMSSCRTRRHVVLWTSSYDTSMRPKQGLSYYFFLRDLGQETPRCTQTPPRWWLNYSIKYSLPMCHMSWAGCPPHTINVSTTNKAWAQPKSLTRWIGRPCVWRWHC